ncbi:hypothetical protein VTO42DRAFT_44 [Malbranchea cinnamomea]
MASPISCVRGNKDSPQPSCEEIALRSLESSKTKGPERAAGNPPSPAQRLDTPQISASAQRKFRTKSAFPIGP